MRRRSMNNANIENLIAVTEVYPDGLKCSAVIFQYKKKIKKETLTTKHFQIDGRRIDRIYVNDSPELAETEKEGCFVVVELSLDDENAGLFHVTGKFPDMRAVVDTPKIQACQCSNVLAADGEIFPAVREMDYNNQVINLLMDDFIQGEYEKLPYNLFIPRDYNAEKKYPLVLFIHDASSCSEDVRATLAQGNGAVVWTSKAEQKKHECFVLAPQFLPNPIVNDSFQTNGDFHKIKPLLDEMIRKYSIDEDRIYETGQSMGCMSGCELNCQYPDLFAASFLVAGQWDPEKMARIPRQNFWIMVSEGDQKAFPGMNAVAERMKAAGANVVHEKWSAKAGQQQWRQDGERLMQTGANVIYTSLDKATVAKGDDSHPGEHHMETWKTAYNVEVVRDWIFSKHK